MKRVLFVFLSILLMNSCSGGDPVGSEPEIPKKEEPETPAEPDVKVEASIILNDTIFNNKTISVSLDTKNEFTKVEYYCDGELIGTSIGSEYKINWTPKDIDGGKHELQCVCVFEQKEYKFTQSTILKLIVGEDFKGGIIVYISDSGNSGVVASKTDLSGGEMDGEFRWGVKGSIIGATSDNGKENTKKIIDAYSESEYSIAAFLKKGVNTAGYDDWYIPSVKEFDYIVKNKELVPNLKLDEKYWTSTEKDINNATFGHFRGTLMGTGNRKDGFLLIRLVRAF